MLNKGKLFAINYQSCSRKIVVKPEVPHVIANDINVSKYEESENIFDDVTEVFVGVFRVECEVQPYGQKCTQNILCDHAQSAEAVAGSLNHNVDECVVQTGKDGQQEETGCTLDMPTCIVSSGVQCSCASHKC